MAVALAVVAALAGWYVANRLVSPMWSVSIHESFPDGRRVEKSFGGRLTIGAFNIAHARGSGSEVLDNFRGGGPWARRQRLSAVAELLVQHQIDLVVLNEIDFWASTTWYQNQARAIAEEAEYPFRVEQRNYDASLLFLAYKSGNAVLSRFPIVDARLVEYPIGRATERLFFGEKRGVLCTIELSPELRVRVLAVHLDHESEDARVRSAEVIERLRLESTVPLVLAGDFNSTLHGFPHAEVDRRGRSAAQLVLDSGAYRTTPTAGASEADFTFSTRRPEKVIDWIFLPRTWRLLGKRTIDSDLSDHRAVVVEAEVHDPRT